MYDFEGSYEGGTMTCSFAREQTTEIPIPDNSEEIVTLDLSIELYVLAAFGPMNGVNPDPLTIGQHLERFGSQEASYLNNYAEM